ncbi:Cell cycle checkpoint protein RAD17 [Hibiscus syriacus]|uniref:Cell cycle checkpoint protein RAD17 n=1 Tax=Hibiscus syriacus TaxID=106335 RepID=A0A6A3ANN5_HIBSY|nr:cell cycle checkpoint protein RAD17 [Hibiscus syriacus]XP_038999755.1 cell cycle checkpoint protein RAD17 [Hibiscus syriacus]KAE8705017.1 Cell cycle checkpoint protein RAD17 [Hibiscus syriacus]
MGKRNTVVISSSDDDDYRPSSRSKRSYEKPKSKSSFSRTNPSRAKKPRLQKSRLTKQSSNVDEMRLAFRDFDEVLNGFKVSSGSKRIDPKELWVDKHKPCSLEELAVNKKKVEEVKSWFEERLRTPKGEIGCSSVLIISGPAGVGKSATVHAIASKLGAHLCEWNTPTPTIWQEHVHNSSAGMNYTSKLDEFENFVERVRKYGLIISSSFNRNSKSSIILVIDDLPVTNGRSAFERLKRCLVLLVRSTRIPTAILITDYGNEDSSDLTAKWMEELQLSLESAGASKVAFNPITNNSIKKTLSRICKQELCNVVAEEIDLIAKASGGDIRHAITSLQLFCLKPNVDLGLSSSNSTVSYPKENANELHTFSCGFSSQYGRDETLTLFHALGKFLHNKRDTENVVALDQNVFRVGEQFSRLPFKMDSPEKILCQAHGQSRPITDFLHENVLDFVSDEAMDDAWTVASYLGDADLLLSTYRRTSTRHSEAENVLQSAAASVAVRGVLYGNFHPSPSRWHAIRKPKLWQIEQSLFHNQKEMLRQRFTVDGGLSSLSEVSVIATEYRPVLKWIGYRKAEDIKTHESDVDSLQRTSMDEKSEISDDDIEDW